MDKEELDKITERIIGAAYKVSNMLGAGFVEKVYENAHTHEMRLEDLYLEICKTMNCLPEQILFIPVHPW